MGLDDLLWLAVFAVPAFLMGWRGTNLHKLADQHRRSDAPPVKPYWVPEELFKPSVYTDEGNKYRAQAALFIYLYPLLWFAAVLLVGYVISRHV